MVALFYNFVIYEFEASKKRQVSLVVKYIFMGFFAVGILNCQYT